MATRRATRWSVSRSRPASRRDATISYGKVIVVKRVALSVERVVSSYARVARAVTGRSEGPVRRIAQFYEAWEAAQGGQASRYVPLSIHSNVKGAESRPIAIRDQHTHEIVATVDRQWLDRRVLTLEGRSVSVAWDDGDALWVAPYRGRDAADRLDYRSGRQLLSHELARLLPER